MTHWSQIGGALKKVSIVIGLYKSEKTITSVINEIREVLGEWKYEYEIILVDDCSPDGVFEVVKKLAETDNRIKVIRLTQKLRTNKCSN